ncbi:hypothetical protein BDR26DRAFT_874138 [Obelidium mucronatum]|nr:hypothetical protein BDR26DRAFT_874138 [Obelidium mucronatum]
MVDELMDEFLESQHTENQNTEYKLVKLNCMQFNDPQSIYKKLLSEFNVQEGDFGTNKNEPYRALERAFGFLEGGDNIRKNKTTKKQKPPSIVQLSIFKLSTELTSLRQETKQFLYRIFEWPTLPGSTLILVGIANALDLMQRYLPRLSGMKGGPQLLNFNPYTPAEISSIIKSRLLLLQQKLWRNARWISFDGKNGCLASGPIGNRENRTPLASANLSNSPAVSTSFVDLHAHLTKLDEIPKVTIQHVLKAAGSVSGPGPVQKVKNLATQQKAVLVAVMDLVGVSGTHSPSATAAVWKPRTESSGVKMLKDPMPTWGLLKRKGGLIKPVTKTEFGDILSLFESVGLISLGKAKEERLRKVRLECLPAQVEEGIRDDPVLWGIWMDMTQDRGL